MTPYIGEIQIFAGNFAPLGWAFCNGQLLSIAENEALFSIIGTIYGGDGVSNFALPNLKNRVPVGTGLNPQGSNFVLGQASGSEETTLTIANLPSHTHTISAKLKVSSQAANNPSPENNYFGKTGTTDPEYASTNDNAMNATGIDISLAPNANGGNQPVNNMQPFVAINYIIALEGIYPSPN